MIIIANFYTCIAFCKFHKANCTHSTTKSSPQINKRTIALLITSKLLTIISKIFWRHIVFCQKTAVLQSYQHFEPTLIVSRETSTINTLSNIVPRETIIFIARLMFHVKQQEINKKQLFAKQFSRFGVFFCVFYCFSIFLMRFS